MRKTKQREHEALAQDRERLRKEVDRLRMKLSVAENATALAYLETGRQLNGILTVHLAALRDAGHGSLDQLREAVNQISDLRVALLNLCADLLVKGGVPEGEVPRP